MWSDSSGRAPAQQEQGPKFKPQYRKNTREKLKWEVTGPFTGYIAIEHPRNLRKQIDRLWAYKNDDHATTLSSPFLACPLPPQNSYPSSSWLIPTCNLLIACFLLIPCEWLTVTFVEVVSKNDWFAISPGPFKLLSQLIFIFPEVFPMSEFLGNGARYHSQLYQFFNS
jgi:hypothetical protein